MRLLLTFFLATQLVYGGEIYLLAESQLAAENKFQQLVNQVGSYLLSNSKVQRDSIQNFKKKHPLYLLPPTRAKEFIWLIKAADGVILEAGILSSNDNLVLLRHRLAEEITNYRTKRNGTHLLHYAHLAYSSGQTNKAKIFLQQARSYPLTSAELKAAQQLEKILWQTP